MSAAARSVFRSSAFRTARMASGPKAKPSFSPFSTSKKNPLSHTLFRSPVELSCCVETMLPYHTATASALLTSMLSVSTRNFGWTAEDCNDDV
ncbi:nuclear fusion defective 6 [Euphorbia peplus]|nr:nuclear fusion defective 6 [Euphorbia peplus]